MTPRLRRSTPGHLRPGDLIADDRDLTVRTVTGIEAGQSNGWLTVDLDGAAPLQLILGSTVCRYRPGQVERRVDGAA